MVSMPLILIMEIDKKHIEGCKCGQASSQKKIYEVLLPYLNSLCKRYHSVSSDRNDILQETFIKIFTKIDQFDSKKGQFHSWASKIAINICLQHSAKSISRRETEITNRELLISVEPEIIKQLSNEELLQFLSTMPKDYYDVFNMYIVDGFSHDEISKILQIKASLSRKRLTRARAWLAKQSPIKKMVV